MDYVNENAKYYLLHCHSFVIMCIIMLYEIYKLNLIGIPVTVDLLLFGNETLNCDVNRSTFVYLWLNKNILQTLVAFMT